MTYFSVEIVVQQKPVREFTHGATVYHPIQLSIAQDGEVVPKSEILIKVMPIPLPISQLMNEMKGELRISIEDSVYNQMDKREWIDIYFCIYV